MHWDQKKPLLFAAKLSKLFLDALLRVSGSKHQKYEFISLGGGKNGGDWCLFITIQISNTN